MLFIIAVFLALFLVPCGFMPVFYYIAILSEMEHTWYAYAARVFLLLSPFISIFIHLIFRHKAAETKKAADCEKVLLISVIVLTLISAGFTAYDTWLNIILSTKSIIQEVLFRGTINCVGLILIMMAISGLKMSKSTTARISNYMILFCGAVWLYNGYFAGTVNFNFLSLTLIIAIGQIICKNSKKFNKA